MGDRRPGTGYMNLLGNGRYRATGQGRQGVGVVQGNSRGRTEPRREHPHGLSGALATSRADKCG